MQSKDGLRAHAACLATRLMDACCLLEEQAHLYRMVDEFEDAQKFSDIAAAGRKSLKEWEEF